MEPQAAVPTVTVAELATWLAKPTPPTVVDVREASEFAEYPLLKGAIHIPMAEIPARMAELPEGLCVVVCRVGGRSAKVAAWLNGQGRTTYSLTGGMKEWSAAHG